MGLFSFFTDAVGFVQPDPDKVARCGDLGTRHAAYHKRIVLVSCICGGIGAVVGIVFLGYAWFDPKLKPNDRSAAFMAPFLCGAAGILFGAAAACLFAPDDFLEGPLGQKWMSFVGTKNVVVARAVCAFISLGVTIPLVWLGVTTAFGK